MTAAVYAAAYTVHVTRIGDDLYQDRDTGLIIETSLCVEAAVSEEAILRWDGVYGRNWLIFVRRARPYSCEVVALR